MVSLGRPYHLKIFEGYLPQILLGPFLNSLAHTMTLYLKQFVSHSVCLHLHRICSWSYAKCSYCYHTSTFIFLCLYTACSHLCSYFHSIHSYISATCSYFMHHVFVFIEYVPTARNFIKEEALAQIFSYEF